MKSKNRLKLEMAGSVIMLFILMITITSSTFAWFSGNKTVDTTGVSSKTNTEKVELQISRSGDNFVPEEECNIVQINSTNLERLMPVSTADLLSFVYDEGSVDGNAVGFKKVENEDRYFHGRIYIRAVSDSAGNQKMTLYLDGNEEAVTAASGMNSASRLGLIFNNDAANPIILKNSNESSQSNTILNGVKLPAGSVLGMNGDSISAFADPAESFDTYSIYVGDDESRLPMKELFELEMNKIYPVDIYFYLEGCDGSCTGDISFEDVVMKLAFYGVLNE